MANLVIETENNRIDIYYNDLSTSFGNRYETIISREDGIVLVDINTDGSTDVTLKDGRVLNLSSSNVDTINGVTATNASISEYFEMNIR